MIYNNVGDILECKRRFKSSSHTKLSTNTRRYYLCFKLMKNNLSTLNNSVLL